MGPAWDLYHLHIAGAIRGDPGLCRLVDKKMAHKISNSIGIGIGTTHRV